MFVITELWTADTVREANMSWRLGCDNKALVVAGLVARGMMLAVGREGGALGHMVCKAAGERQGLPYTVIFRP